MDGVQFGDDGRVQHKGVGKGVAERGIEQFWCAGPLSAHAATAFGSEARHFPSSAELVSALPQGPDANSLLVKGSRYMRMEQAVAALTGTPEGAH